MTPKDLSRDVRRSWPVATIAFLIVFAGLVLPAASKPHTYTAGQTLSVQPTGATGDTNITFSSTGLQLLIPVFQARATSGQLKADARAQVPGAAQAVFSVSATITPNTGLIVMGITSNVESMVIPTLVLYANELSTYAGPGTGNANLPVNVKLVQRSTSVSVDSTVTRIGVAGLEGIVLGGIVGVGLSVFLGRRRRRRDLSTRIEAELNQRVLAEVPRYERGKVAHADELIHVVAHLKPQIDTHALLSIAFISPRHGSGRTTLAARTARGLAEVGESVLLVEADLRRPRLDTMLHEELVESQNSDDVHRQRIPETAMPITATSMPGLFLLRATHLSDYARRLGARSGEPWAAVVSSIDSILAECKSAGLFVIVDTPCAPGTAEADAVAVAVDGVIVIADGRLRGQAVDEVDSTLSETRELGANVLGVVVNWGRRSRGKAPA